MVAKGSESSGSESPEKPGKSKGARVETQEAEGGATRPMLDLEFVRGLIEAVDGSGIDSLEITRAGTRVKISKTPPSVGPAQGYYAPHPAAPHPAPPQQGAPAPAPPATAAAPAEEPADASAGKGDGFVDIKSPMVGTFYRSPAPEAPSYVEVGTKVGKGQTLCILEAMKLMNELESEVDGVVREILVENAEPVEYGQVLFRIDPNG